MHNFPSAARAPFDLPRQPETSPPTVRGGGVGDIKAIWELVATFAAKGSMLPRTPADIAARIDSYVVATDGAGRVLACAALEEFSPSLGEVASVAVARSEHGNGLGTQVVLGVERLARARNIEELFAMSLTDNFFLSLGYELTTISRYPEKLARYERLKGAGVEIVPKRCFKKRMDGEWTPVLVEKSGQRRMVG